MQILFLRLDSYIHMPFFSSLLFSLFLQLLLRLCAVSILMYVLSVRFVFGNCCLSLLLLIFIHFFNSQTLQLKEKYPKSEMVINSWKPAYFILQKFSLVSLKFAFTMLIHFEKQDELQCHNLPLMSFLYFFYQSLIKFSQYCSLLAFCWCELSNNAESNESKTFYHRFQLASS